MKIFFRVKANKWESISIQMMLVIIEKDQKKNTMKLKMALEWMARIPRIGNDQKLI